MKFTSLTGRFVLWFIVVTLLPLALFGYLSLRQNENALRSEALSRMSRLADKKALQIKAYLAERIQDAQLLARSNLAETAMSDLSRTYARYGAHSAEYHRAAKPFDKNFAAYIGAGEDTLFYDVFLITPQGEIVYTNKHEPDFTTNLLNGTYSDSQLAQVFRESRMTLESSISDFEHYAPSNEPAAFVSAPVIREGVLLGVVAFQLDTQRIYQVAGDNIGLGVTGESPLAKLTGAGEALFVAPLRQDPKAAMQLKLDLKTVGVPTHNALSGLRGSGVEIDYSGKRVVAAWRYLPELRWGMVVKMDADEVFAPLYQQQKILLQALLGLILFAGAVAFYFGRHLVMPLKSLAANADEIAQGDFNKRVDESRADEIGMLGRAFNHMAGNLQALYRTLEDRVEERTRELNVSNEQLQEEIIEREHIEKALRESQEATWHTLEDLNRSETRLRTLYDTTSDAVMMLDDKGFFDCNNATLALFGCTTKEELCSKHPAELSPPQQPCGTDSMTLSNRQIATAMKQGTHQFEWMHRRIDTGMIFPAEVLLNRMELDGRIVLQATVRDITARKQVESALQMTRIGVDRSSDSLFWMTSDAHILDVNDAPCRALGYTREELLQLTVADIDVNFKAEIWPQHFDDLRKNGSMTFESTQRTKDGRLIPVEIGANYFKLGNEEYNFAVVRDITERKQAEKRLAYSEALFRGLFENINSGVAVYEAVNDGEDFIFKDYNRAGQLMDSTKREDVINKRLTECFPGVKEFGLFAVLQRVWKSGVSEHFPTNAYSDSRLLTWRDSQVYRLPSGDVVAVYDDVTARKQAEEQLRVAAAAFETHEAILITDANSNIIRVNQAFQDITGYSSEEVLGKNPRILSSGRQDKAFYAAMWQQLLATGSWSGEMWDRRKGGQIYPKWLTITAVKNEQGNTTEYVAIFSDITARKQAEEEIHNLAFYDALTRLPNRRLLLDRFRSALSVSARSNHYGAVLFLDMDRFKTLNDTLGHDYGDMLLIEVAQRLQSCVREVDTVARLGGDEFVVLLEEADTDAEQASQKVALIAEKIRASLAAPYRLKDSEHHSSPSIGVCLYRGNEESVDALLKHADMAMYQAKDSGRNAVRFFDPAMQLAVETRAALEADLRHAVSDKQLRLYYQIQLDNDHRPLGAEALVRWIHPKRGMVSPAQFIPIAEESSLILDVGHWVLETACRQLKEWGKHEQTRHLELAVNVSAQQFRLQTFVDMVASMVRIHQVIPSCLKLELTESVVLTDVADIVKKMHALKALGIKLSLDDFGTGYSSLSYLKQLPLDQLKIDQSFVRDIATDPNDAVMVQTIIGLAHNFRLNVIAEGVETEAQLAFLKLHGCMAYQGYLFSKPVPIEEFEALLKL